MRCIYRDKKVVSVFVAFSCAASTAILPNYKLTVEDGNPEINVQVDRDKMAALGLTLKP
jgi:multidrug efflux pump subunit AcrB